MILAWYEKLVDTKNYMLFDKREFTRKLNRNHTPHFHKGIEIALCLEGDNSEVFINGEYYPFARGTICFVNSLAIHKYAFDAGAQRYVVVLSSDILKAVGWDEKTVFPCITNDPDTFRELKAFLDLAYRNWAADDELLKISFVGMLFSLMKRLIPTEQKQNEERYNGTLIDFLTYISGNSEKKITVSDVAAHFGYSPNYFSAIFKKLTGVTFKEYLNFCRVVNYNRMRERDDTVGVAEAAEKCGFGSVKSLYRACKRSKEMRTYYAGISSRVVLDTK